ncbi:MAG: lipid-A-disaccharide synthase [Smithellaceae bacterium]|nr:lipid-A-disaccharide synthase [Smithellaceae bacterium]
MPPENKKTVMIMAGEASGDNHGANLVLELKRLDPEIHLIGLGGDRMREAGVRMILDAADIAVVGVTEAVFKLGRLWKAMRQVRRTIRDNRPDLLILIDFPDFNLHAASYAKKLGVRVLYYISPQIWAWRGGRIKKIRKTVDRMAVILPFEEDIYRAANVDATFVGHPLLDDVKTRYSPGEARKHFHLTEGITTIALLPGSREKEVARHLPDLLRAGELISAKLPAVQFILPLADTIDEGLVLPDTDQSSLYIKVVQGKIYDAISTADLAIVASGTATLETALLGIPMVIIYRVSWLSYLIGRLLIKVRHIGLVNIIAGKTIMPELIQERATPEEIAGEALAILTDPERREGMRTELAALREKLGRPGAAERTAKIAYDMINGDH